MTAVSYGQVLCSLDQGYSNRRQARGFQTDRRQCCQNQREPSVNQKSSERRVAELLCSGAAKTLATSPRRRHKTTGEADEELFEGELTTGRRNARMGTTVKRVPIVKKRKVSPAARWSARGILLRTGCCAAWQTRRSSSVIRATGSNASLPAGGSRKVSTTGSGGGSRARLSCPRCGHLTPPPLARSLPGLVLTFRPCLAMLEPFRSDTGQTRRRAI